ncbi:MAG: nucleoside:proton symporter [Betaproteobacteria bacterium]|nr:nucleoside:proton symporter [Betaproteobacteria bacterium]PWB66696.1 MAG: nucleoside:proton symporter [Betaproteobacteria bacterium]
MQALHALAGIAALLALSWALSEDRRGVRWRVVAAGLALTVALAGLLLAVPWLRDAVFSLNAGLAALERATQAGTTFVFGFLAGGPAPYAETNPGASFVLAFRALPLVLVVSALSALLFHWRVLPVVVKAFAWVLNRSMGLGGAVGVSSAVNVFVGMVEAPLVVKPYLARLSRSELFMVMVCGMATIAGTVLALYGAILAPVVPDAIGHVIVASFVATPAAIVVAALMVPGTMSDEAAIEIPRQDATAMDAVTRGTMEGAQLLIQIVAMLVVLIALVHLANAALSLLPAVDGSPLTLQRMLGWLFAPLAWTAGVPWAEAQAGGALLGTKTILNEFVAYLDLAKLPAGELSARSRLLMTYALCGFANFGSLGILIGGMGAMVPERRGEIVSLGMKSIVAGTLATCLTAAVVGIFV